LGAKDEPHRLTQVEQHNVAGLANTSAPSVFTLTAPSSTKQMPRWSSLGALDGSWMSVAQSQVVEVRTNVRLAQI
jgi:hypothetical protein